MPIFENTMRRTDNLSPQEAIAVMDRHLRVLQDQLEWRLAHLDSSNVIDIDTNVTQVGSGDGSATITGDQIIMTGNRGEGFRVGQDTAAGRFRLELVDRSGSTVFYLDSSGVLNIGRNATVTIDGGEWE